MAQDRVVRWREIIPNNQQIKEALEDYVGEAGSVVITDRLYCVLSGKTSPALKRVAPGRARTVAIGYNAERRFEVCIGKDFINVITRMADEFTSAVAEGFAVLCANAWRGEREE